MGNCRCVKCNHIWIKRTEEYPRMCPRCKSYFWRHDDEEDYKKDGEIKKEK